MECHHPARDVDHRRRITERYGCDRPADDLGAKGGADSGCAECECELGCTVDEHGHYYIGPSHGRGFRTNRCPRSWAASEFVAEVRVAHYWVERPGGSLAMLWGDKPPALLLDAVLMYGVESENAIDEYKAWLAKPRTQAGMHGGMGDRPIGTAEPEDGRLGGPTVAEEEWSSPGPGVNQDGWATPYRG